LSFLSWYSFSIAGAVQALLLPKSWVVFVGRLFKIKSKPKMEMMCTAKN